MAVNDIFKADILLEGPDGPASFGVHFKEGTANTTAFDECSDIAEALKINIGEKLLDILSDEWFFSGIRVSKRSGNPRPMALVDGYVTAHLSSQGQVDSPALPANNAYLFTLQQSTFGARSNGKVYVPGVPESKTDGSILLTAWASTEVNNFAQFLELDVQSQSDTGLWWLGVISQKHLVANPGDWSGAFAVAGQVVPDSYLAIQRRRAGRQRGYSKVA